MRSGLAAIVALAVCVGCVTAAKQAYYTATGPQGSYLIISQTSAPLERYKALEIASFRNDVPSAVGQFLLEAVQEQAVQEMLQSRYFESVTAVPQFTQGKAEKPALVVRGTILDITSDTVPGQKLLDSNYLLAAVELVDKESGQVLVKANVRGVVKSVAQSGETPLAQGMGRGLKKLFKDLLHKTEKEE